MIWLSEKIEFPSYQSTSKDGIIALGGDLSPERLIFAYQHGIFPVSYTHLTLPTN